MTSSEFVWRSGASARAPVVDGLVVAAFAALLLAPSLLYGPPTGYDYPIHNAWFELFPEAMSLSEPYPRWLGGLWFGAGGADFYFYPPLTYWLAGGLQGLTQGFFTPDGLMLAVGAIALAASGLGFYALGQRFAGRGPAMLAALVYMALPYHLGVDWYYRVAMAEFIAMAVLPWHLAAFVDCLRGRNGRIRFAVLSALFALAHLPTAVVVAPVYLVLACTIEGARDWRRVGGCILAVGIGFGLAAIYWYPAVSLLDLARNDLLGDAGWAAKSLIAPINIERDPTVALVWPPFGVLSLLSAAALLVARKEMPRLVATSAVLLALTWVMVTPLSLPLWLSEWLRFIQFPVRYLMIGDVAFALAALCAAATMKARDKGQVRRGLAGAALVAMVLATVAWHPVFPVTPTRATPVSHPTLFGGALEWLPEESRSDDFISLPNWPRVIAEAKAEATRPTLRIDGRGTARLEDEEPRRVMFEANLAVPTRVVVHRTYYRFWRLENLETGERIALAPTDRFPLIEATLPAGASRFALTLPTLPEERIGALISAWALLLLVAWAWLSRRRRRS